MGITITFNLGFISFLNLFIHFKSNISPFSPPSTPHTSLPRPTPGVNLSPGFTLTPREKNINNDQLKNNILGTSIFF